MTNETAKHLPQIIENIDRLYVKKPAIQMIESAKQNNKPNDFQTEFHYPIIENAG